MKNKNQWNDATSYSRDDKERKPTAWEICGDRLRIYITCRHINNPGNWVMHCRPWFDTTDLKVDTLEEAKEKAVKMVYAVLAKCANDIEMFRAN